MLSEICQNRPQSESLRRRHGTFVACFRTVDFREKLTARETRIRVIDFPLLHNFFFLR